MASSDVRRRRFLQAGVSAAVAATASSCNSTRSPWRSLSVSEARTLGAICDQIVPPDQHPGAQDAGVVAFIDLQLTKFHRPFRDLYRRGLAAVDETSVAMHGAPFADLTWDKQTQVLKAIEGGEPKGEGWKTTQPKAFFDTVVAHTMQGYYGSPRHGGNRDAVSWRMLGVPNPPLRGRAHYDFTKKG